MSDNDELIQIAKASGRIQILIELKDWLNAKIAEAEEENELYKDSLEQQKRELEKQVH